MRSCRRSSTNTSSPAAPCRRDHRRTARCGCWAISCTRRKVWGLTLGFACYGYSNSLFASWLPTYFVQTMNVCLLKSASFTMLPWFIATVAQFVIAGWLVDRLVKRGHDETLVRKSTIIACLLGGLAILGAAFTTGRVLGAVLDDNIGQRADDCIEPSVGRFRRWSRRAVAAARWAPS